MSIKVSGLSWMEFGTDYKDRSVDNSLPNICSYCGGKVRPAQISVKRPVPQGATDLGLSDTVFVWRCSKCNATTEEAGTCHRCKKTAFFGHEASSGKSFEMFAELEEGMTDIPLWYILESHKPAFEAGTCTSCHPIACYYCNGQIADKRKLYHSEVELPETYTIRERNAPFHYQKPVFCHQACLVEAQQKEAEQIAREIAEQQRKHEIQKREAEIQEQEKLARERIAEERKARGQCTLCGEKLGLIAKLNGSKRHAKCSTFRSS